MNGNQMAADQSVIASTVLPTPERARRGVELIPQAIADEDGRPSQPYRAIDVLASLLKRGAITYEMLLAAERFRYEFHISSLEALIAADVSRPMVSGRRRTPILPGKVEDARESVYEAIRAVGGQGSIGGSCLWDVIGLERQIMEWCFEQGKQGLRITPQEAPGVIRTVLSILEKHYENNA